MAYWSFEDLIGNFPRMFEMNQSYGRSREILEANVATRPGDQDLLIEGIQSVDPGYTITAQDEAERAERREISEIARNNLFAFFHKFGGLRKGRSLERGIDLVFDFGNDPKAVAHDEQALSLFSRKEEHVPGDNGGQTIYTYNSTIDERTEFVKARLDQLFQTDFSKMYTMTDRDVAENFTKLYPVYLMMAEGGDNLAKLNGKLFNLPQSYLDKMVELKWQHQGIFGLMKNRFDCIMNPNYEIFHYERMKPAEERDFADVGPGGAEDLEARVRGSADALEFFRTLGKFQQFSQTAYVDMINHEIRKLNLPKEMLLPPEVDDKDDRIASPLLKIFLPGNGVELSTEDLKKGFDMVCFTNPATGQTHFLKSDGVNYKSVDMSRLPEPLRSEPDKLMKALEEADPWYIRIFTGSKQFDEMKKAMKAVQELKDEMRLNPTREQREEMANRLSTLTEKAGYYLQSKAAGIQMDSSDAERARITAAERLLEYSLEGRALLAGYEQTLAFKAKVHDAAEAANEKGMKEQVAKEDAFLRARDLTQPVYSKPLTKEDINREVRALNNQMLKTYMNNLKDGDPLKRLGRTIFTEIDKDLYVAKSETGVYHTETPKFSLLSAPDGILANAVSWKTIPDLNGLKNNAPADPVSAQKDLKNMLANLVTFDLIMRERAQQAKGEIGPLEKQFREIGPSRFSAEIGKSKTLQDLSANMNAKEFRALVGRAAGEGGIQKLTAQVLEEYQKPQAQKEPQQPQPQQVLQQNVPEPPKPAVHGGMG